LEARLGWGVNPRGGGGEPRAPQAPTRKGVGCCFYVRLHPDGGGGEPLTFFSLKGGTEGGPGGSEIFGTGVGWGRFGAPRVLAG